VGETKRESYKPLPPFPRRLRGIASKVDEANQEILETCRKVKTNIPLLDAIEHVHHYVKFLKKLCTAKCKLKGNKKVNVGENVSILFQKKLHPTCKD